MIKDMLLEYTELQAELSKLELSSEVMDMVHTFQERLDGLAEEIEEAYTDSDLLYCLRNAGVDNWDGWDFAIEEYESMHPENS
jgi:hypothetical protein